MEPWLPSGRRRAGLMLAGGLALAGGQMVVQAIPPAAPEPGSAAARADNPGLFSAAQAEFGKAVYQEHCTSCHGSALEGGAGPALAGPHFVEAWANGKKTVDDLVYIVSSMMPLQAPRSLAKDQYNAVVAYILSRNGYRAGAEALDPSAHPGMAKAVLQPPSASAVAAPAPSEHPVLPRPPASVAHATTATPDDAELVRADSATWLMYNRSFSGERYSSLAQITPANAAQLAPVCIFQAGEVGSFQASPVIYDGTLYITTPFNTYAIGAGDCRLKWKHDYPADPNTTVSLSRGVAIYRGKLFRITPNGHLLALDAKTGKLLWDVWLADKAHGYWLSAAPIAYDGRVFIGTAGADWGANGKLFAFDTETGAHDWTFDVIPAGKQAGADSWKSGAERGGGSMWSSFSLDPARKLLFASIGNPAPDYNGAMRPGDNLYTNSVVALDYRTGKLAWYVQQVPHDVHDWDTAAAPSLYSVGGRDYLSVANKGGWLYIYDRATRKLLAKTEVSPHENVDVPMSPEGVHHCPGIVGGVQWNGTAFSPQTKLLYVNSVNWCGTTRLSENRYVEGSSYFDGDHTWDPVETARGWTRGVDATTGKIVWSREFRAPMLAALTPTAGGVLFTGDLDGAFLALDAKSGRTLYAFNTGGAVAGAPSTYLDGGRQMVAITSGNSSRSVWRTMGAATVVVFALPTR